jgi:long-chain acyl-CoA synthetase
MPPVLGADLVSAVQHNGTATEAQQLARRIDRAARRLPTGCRVAVLDGDALSRLCWFLAADTAGCAALLTDPNWSAEQLRAVLDDARPQATVDPATGRISAFGPGHPPVDGPSAHFYLPTTSGSSGTPKVLVRSRGSWLRSFDALDIGIGPHDRVLVPGPLSSSLFLFGALHALHFQAGLELLDSWAPARAAQALRRCTAVHLVPAMLAALLVELERDPQLRADCRLRTVVCGGAAVPAELAERLARVLPQASLVEYYGSAEQSLVAVDRGSGLRPVVEVAVDQDGQLWARSDLTADGYLVRGRIVPPHGWRDGWSTAGDRAALLDDGRLRVLGRRESVLNPGGQLVSAEEVEAALRAVPGVCDVVVTATPHPRFGDLVTAVIEAAPHGPPDVRELRRRAKQALQPAARPRRWLVTEALPRTSSGKPARGSITDQLQNGTLEATAL